MSKNNHERGRRAVTGSPVALLRRVLGFVCSCDCMSCVHGQHCGMCRADNRFHRANDAAGAGCGS